MKTSVFFRLLDFSQKRNHISLESLEETFWWRHANAEKKVFSDFFLLSIFISLLSRLSLMPTSCFVLTSCFVPPSAQKCFEKKFFKTFQNRLVLIWSLLCYFKMDHSRRHFSLFLSFQFSWREINVLYKNWPKIVVKLRTSGVANDLSVYWATTSFLFCISQERYY